MHRNVVKVAILGVSFLFAGVVLAGGIHTRGSGAPTQQTIFSIDTPVDGATVFGIVQVSGFVLDPRGVSRITLLIDGAAVHDADINQPRADVRLKYPSFAGEGFPYNPGFVTSFLASNYAAGDHTLAIQVTFSNSDVQTLGSRTVTVDHTIDQAPLGALDSPRDPTLYGAMQDYVTGVYPITGWAIDDTGIRQRGSPTGCNPDTDPTCHVLADIEVMVDNGVVGQVIYPLPRPDIANAYPDVPGAFKSGWQMNLDTTRYTNGIHTIAVRAWDTAGMNSIIGSETIAIDNSYSTLAPFGRINWPMPNGHLFDTDCTTVGISGAFQQGTRVEWVSGWVVDQNDILRYQGVKYVELLLDGVLLASTTEEEAGADCSNVVSPPGSPCYCWFYPAFGMLVDCYGYERPDILYQYPQFSADAKDSGFFFVLDIDQVLSLGIHQGLHYLAIRVGTQDPDRPPVIIDQIPVFLECDPASQFTSFGELEQPINMQLMQGSSLIKGWVYAYVGVHQLNFYVDGVLDGSLTSPNPNLGLLRLDLRTRYPWYGYILDHAGFQYTLDTTKYVDGIHQLVIESVDAGGAHNYWVQRPISFNNLNRP
ncbi:MAG: hypothetical protein ACHQQS_03140 [Thermoanaerobaculales bacterium]